MADLLLCGGTGDLGGHIAQRLAAEGAPFRALVRPTSDTAALKSVGAELAVGDLTDPPSLERALAGIRTVVTTVNAMNRRLMAGERGASIDAVDRRGQANLVAAAERAGAERFVYVSMACLSEQMTQVSPYSAAKRDSERLLEASPMRTVLVRPSAFLEIWLNSANGIDPAKRRAMIYGTGRTPVTYVSVADVAAACVRVATMPDPPATLEFGGPEALTMRQAAELCERTFGGRFRRIVVPRAVLHLASRVLRRRKPELASVMGMALVTDIEGCAPSAEPLRRLGIEPRTPEEFVTGLAR